jgi:hypothetical protein
MDNLTYGEKEMILFLHSQWLADVANELFVNLITNANAEVKDKG